MNAVEIVTDLLQVIIGGLVLGAGLPALFAVGIRLASGSGTVFKKRLQVCVLGLLLWPSLQAFCGSLKA